MKENILVIFIIMVVLLCFYLPIYYANNDTNNNTNNTQIYIYKTDRIDDSDLEQTLNTYSRQGWEPILIKRHHCDISSTVIFRKKK